MRQWVNQTRSPRARISLRTASIPRLSIMRMPLEERRKLTNRPSEATQNLCVCKLGKKRRRRRFLACDTLLPDMGLLPVTWHTLDMGNCSEKFCMIGETANRHFHNAEPAKHSEFFSWAQAGMTPDCSPARSSGLHLLLMDRIFTVSYTHLTLPTIYSV